MEVAAPYLVDTSALARMPHPRVAAVLEPLCILHYDQDLERIAAVTEQAAQWVVPRASI